MRLYPTTEFATQSYRGVAEPADTLSMPPTKKFTIYAAPRAKNGQYRRTDEKPLFYKEFESLAAMERYWKKYIVPKTSTRFGRDYELSMVEADRVMWDFVGDPRYADVPVLSSKILAGANVFRC